MAGTGYASSDLLKVWNQLSGRPPADVISDADKYLRLAQAQDEILLEITSLAGNVLFGNPTLMTSADGGYTYTFGTDGNGYANFLLAGHIYPSLSAVPNYMWTPGIDYVDEGTQIRSLNNTPFSVAPYFQGVTTPAFMSASVQPVLQPSAGRMLIPIRAAMNFGMEGNRNPALAQTMAARYQTEFGKIMTQIRKHLRGGPQSGRSGLLALSGVGRGWNRW